MGWERGMPAAFAIVLALLLVHTTSAPGEDIEPDFYGIMGQPLALNVTVDPGGPVDLFHWDFDGDGVFDLSSVQPNVTHTYPEAGTYQAVLRANLTNTSVRMWLYTVEIAPRNQVPVVVITGHAEGYVRTDRITPVELSGMAVDDGEVVRYDWDFEGDGVFDWNSPEVRSVNHTYSELGIFTAVLKATDDQGAVGVATLTVDVRNLAPHIDQRTRLSTNVPLVSLSITAEDPDGEIVLYTWDLGDGSPLVNTTVPTVTHTYPDLGRYYQVRVEVLDNDGSSSTTTFMVEVSRPDPFELHKVDAGPDVETVVGRPVQFHVNVTDGTEAIVHYYWDLDGDATADADGMTQTYVYSADGTYHVSVSVVDEWGFAVNDTLVVTVHPEENEAPVPVPSVEQWVRPGRNLRFSEVSYDPDGRIVLYQWDFDGDGKFDHADPDDGNVTHLYVEEGMYVAVLQVTDNRGEVASASVTIKVNNDAPGENEVDDSKGAAVCCLSLV
ncbi:MAG: PKD domain-containing protein, partial [Thermoplasmata archaeon]|nr:PKD domain-containing protein [Thermoplasmata archaeon]